MLSVQCPVISDNHEFEADERKLLRASCMMSLACLSRQTMTWLMEVPGSVTTDLDGLANHPIEPALILSSSADTS